MEGGMKNSDLSLEELQIDNQNHQSNYASSDPELQSMETTGSDHHQQHQHHQDEYLLEQMLSSHLPNCSWPDLVSNSSSAIANPNPNKAAFLLQQQQLLNPFSLASGGGDHLMDPRHLLVDHPSQHHEMGAEGAVQAMYNGFPGPLHGNGGTATQQPFETSASPASASTERSGGQARQRVRARRGQATDPHSIAERLRRERIAERMKGLQQLVPNANKTDKASMLDEIIDYVKFLQVQVKVLSMSRLGGKAAAAPLIAALSSEGGSGGGIGPSSNRNQDAGPTNDSSMSMTENQVVKLMEEDMGSAMQYLQGKGLCLMPISLATAISTANGVNANRPIPPLNGNGGGKGPSSPSLGSVLSVKSTNSVNGDGSAKDSSPA